MTSRGEHSGRGTALALHTRAVHALLRPVDGSSLAALRILYGLILCVSMLRFEAYGWVERLFVAPRFHFKYWGFGWVEPLPGPYMHALFWALAALALAVAFGLCFRITATAFALGLSYVQLIDVSTYLNHYYLAALLAWLLAASPAGRLASLDALWRTRRTRRTRRTQHNPESVAQTPTYAPPRTAEATQRQLVGAGWLYLFRFQLGLVYFFAGVAKAQADWLLHAQPLRIWLGGRTDLPLIGQLLTIDALPLLMSWAGFLFDATICLWLCWGKTRRLAYAVLVVFHLATGLLLPIGMFPVIMIAATSVFFSPSWPRRLFGRDSRERQPPRPVISPVAPRATAKLGVGLGLGYCLLQLLLPLRFLTYGGNVLWHEQGMRLSWRVMLRAKGGTTTFLVRDPRTGRSVQVNPREYLTEMQNGEMASQPDLIVQLAHHIQSDLHARGLGPVEVRADARASLNGRRSQPLLDPHVDLTSVADSPLPATFILPAPTRPPPRTRPVL